MSEIGSNYDVIFFPTFGIYHEESETWAIPIHGAVVKHGEPNLRKRLMIRVLKRVMDAEPEDFDTEIFNDRIQTFVAAAQRGKRIMVKIGNEDYLVARKSSRAGLFSGVVRIPHDRIASLRESGDLKAGWLRFTLHTDGEGAQTECAETEGTAQLVSPFGVSIISDIDDTIKQTTVSDRQELLANTFLREFSPIDGMSPVYQRWAEAGAVMHYVSSSPWQLYNSLSDFCGSELFPNGTFHLRYFRLRDHLAKRVLTIRRRGKAQVIFKLLAAFPQRRFLLVGDSGEIDPEIYALACKKFKDQVAGVYIRELPERQLSEERIEKIQRRLGKTPFHIFCTPEELPEVPPVLLEDQGAWSATSNKITQR